MTSSQPTQPTPVPATPSGDPAFSVVIPTYRVIEYLRVAVDSVLAQTFQDFEIIVVDDCCPDDSAQCLADIADPRLKIVRHPRNKGLAASRNTGVRHSRGRYVALLDADDFWEPRKLEAHFEHLERRPGVGLSFCRSAFVDTRGRPINGYQMPVLENIDPALLMQRNPVGNGSAAVLRRSAIAAVLEVQDQTWSEGCLFDEQFRRSEDIECWVRLALVTDWCIEGIPDVLTCYRINASGLSAKVREQLASWERMISKTSMYAEEFVAANVGLARAYQLRYLCRQAVQHRDPVAIELIHRAIRTDWRIIRREPARTVLTLLAAHAQRLLPIALYRRAERCAWHWVVSRQRRQLGLEG